MHSLPRRIELRGLQVRGVWLEVFYTASGEGASGFAEKRAGGCEGGKKAVVWRGFIGVGVGGCVCLRAGLAVTWTDAIFGDVCHSEYRSCDFCKTSSRREV